MNGTQHLPLTSDKYITEFDTYVLPPHIHPLRLHSGFVIQANMQNDDQTLRCTSNSILELLTPAVPMFDFIETVKFIMVTPENRSGDVPIQLIKVMASFAAYMKQTWGDSTDGIGAEIFLNSRLQAVSVRCTG
jgi:hypothetical protein